MFITVAILMYRIFNTYLYDTNLSALVMGDSSILTYFRFVMLIFKYQYREPDETALDNAGRSAKAAFIGRLFGIAVNCWTL